MIKSTDFRFFVRDLGRFFWKLWRIVENFFPKNLMAICPGGSIFHNWISNQGCSKNIITTLFFWGSLIHSHWHSHTYIFIFINHNNYKVFIGFNTISFQYFPAVVEAVFSLLFCCIMLLLLLLQLMLVLFS